MKSKQHLLRVFIEKFFKGKLSNDQSTILNDFFRKEYNSSQNSVADIPDKETIGEDIWLNVKHRISPAPKVRYMHYLTYAAAACVVMALSISLFLKEDKLEIVTTGATIDSIQLSDGSLVYLGAYSELHYPKQFTGAKRELILSNGNAFFKVTPNKEKPFIVYANTIATKVLGTSFNIKTCTTQTEVVVATGKVNVSNKTHSVDLIPFEKVTSNNKRFIKERVENVEFSNWFKNEFTFKESRLTAITSLLQYKYNVLFSFEDDTVKEQMITLSISKDDTLEEILQNLSFITELNFNIYDRKVIVTKN